MTTYLRKFVQHPDERKRYTIDYQEWLDSSETLSSVTFEVDPVTTTPLVVDGDVVSVDGKSVSFFLSAGNDGETYDVLVTATTSAGQIKVINIVFAVRDY